jgi:hypothetical protein
MASKSGSTYREDMLSRSTTAPKRARSDGAGDIPSIDRKTSQIPDHLRASSPPAPTPVNFDPSSSREALIATAAYYRAESRGFVPGFETEDWLAAEREIDAMGSPPGDR